MWMKNFIKTYENGINFDANMEKHPQTILPLDGVFLFRLILCSSHDWLKCCNENDLNYK